MLEYHTTNVDVEIMTNNLHSSTVARNLEELICNGILVEVGCISAITVLLDYTCKYLASKMDTYC